MVKMNKKVDKYEKDDKPRKMSRNKYERELAILEIELVKF